MKMILLSVVFSVASTIWLPSCTNNAPSEPARTWFKAKGESNRQPLVTFLVFGQTIDQSGNQIGKSIQAQLEERKIPSKYYLVNRDDDSVAVAFFLKGKIYRFTKFPGASQKFLTDVSTEFSRMWPNYVYDEVVSKE